MEEYFTPKSSFITAICYDHKTKMLTVEIKEKPYSYQNVPMTCWESLKAAESIGQYYTKHIKGCYEPANAIVEQDRVEGTESSLAIG